MGGQAAVGPHCKKSYRWAEIAWKFPAHPVNLAYGFLFEEFRIASSVEEEDGSSGFEAALPEIFQKPGGRLASIDIVQENSASAGEEMDGILALHGLSGISTPEKGIVNDDGLSIHSRIKNPAGRLDERKNFRLKPVLLVRDAEADHLAGPFCYSLAYDEAGLCARRRGGEDDGAELNAKASLVVHYF